MDYEIDINLPGRTSGITVCGDGEVDIVAQSGYEDISITFELEELEEMVKQAKAHNVAYEAYVANDYEDIVLPKVGDMAKPNWGRNADRWGEILAVDSKDLSVMIDFGGTIQLSPSGTTEPDQYWSSIKRIELLEESK